MSLNTTARVFTRGIEAILRGAVKWPDATTATNYLYAMLLTSSYTPNIEADRYYANISANEVSNSGTGYTTGGAKCTISGIAVPIEPFIYPADTPYADADGGYVLTRLAPITFSALTLANVKYIVLYNNLVDGQSPGGKPLIGIINVDSGGSPGYLALTNQDLVITWPTTDHAGVSDTTAVIDFMTNNQTHTP